MTRVAHAALCVLALALASCDAFKQLPQEAERSPTWMVFVESDFQLGPRYWQGSSPTTAATSQPQRCGDDKFDRVWAAVERVVNDAAGENASVELLPIAPSPKPLSEAHFNSRDPQLKNLVNDPRPEKDTEDDRADRLSKLRGAVVKDGKNAHAAALSDASQTTQDLFDSVEYLRQQLPDRLSQASKVVVVYVSDMVHYNTSKAGQLSPAKGLVNMFSSADRRALTERREENPDWWIGDRSLMPISSSAGAFEVRTVDIQRCDLGELLPEADGINWSLLRGDVSQFWRETFTSLGASGVRWNYR